MTSQAFLTMSWVAQPHAVKIISLNHWVVTQPLMPENTTVLADIHELLVSDNRFQGLSTRAAKGASAPKKRCSHLDVIRHGIL